MLPKIGGIVRLPRAAAGGGDALLRQRIRDDLDRILTVKVNGGALQVREDALVELLEFWDPVTDEDVYAWRVLAWPGSSVGSRHS